MLLAFEYQLATIGMWGPRGSICFNMLLTGKGSEVLQKSAVQYNMMYDVVLCGICHEPVLTAEGHPCQLVKWACPDASSYVLCAGIVKGMST